MLAVLVVIYAFTTTQASCGTLRERRPEDRVVVAGGQDDARFTGGGGLHVDREGRLLFLDVHDRVVRVFSATGQGTASFGRGGEGPGEFRAPRTIGGGDDELWVTDAGGIVHVFDTEGGFLEVVRPSRLGEDRIGFTAVTPDWLLATAVVSPTDREIAVPYLRVARRDPGVRDTLFSLTLRTEAIEVEGVFGPNSRLRGQQFFEDSDLVSVSADGRTVYRVERPAGGLDGEFGFRIASVRTEDRDRLDAFVPVEPVPLDAGTIQVIVDQKVDELLGEVERRGLSLPLTRAELQRRFRSALKTPRFLPPIHRALAGADGRLWVERWLGAGERRARWCVFDEALLPVAAVWLPEGGELLAARGDTIWVEQTGPLEIPQLVRYTLSP